MANDVRVNSSTPEHAARVAGLRDQLAVHHGELLEMLASPEQAGLPFARRHAEIMDELLCSLFASGFARSGRNGRDAPVVLGAVGGYGRCTLGWKSDLDVRLLTTKRPEELQPLAETILYPLWDAGVSIGHQVTTIPDALAAAEEDLPTATALLDFRALCGETTLALALEDRGMRSVFAPGKLGRFLQRLEEEAEARNERLGDARHMLEPDVKNGAGGLRDLDVVHWTTRVRWRVKDVRELLPHGVLVAREVDELLRAADFLWAVRNRLHASAGRRSDRLTFPEQEQLARAMGYRARVKPNGGASDDALARVMTEAFMSDYQRHTRVIARSREQLMARAMPPRFRLLPARARKLGPGLIEREGRVFVADEAALGSDPALALRLYAAAAKRDLRVDPETRSAITRAARDGSFGAALRDSAEAVELFTGLLASGARTRFRNGSILTELHDVGLLVALIPELQPLVGRVHHDDFHVYTADEHSIAAVDHLRALRRGELRAEQPRASRVLAEIADPAPLLLATLLHDVGKAIGEQDHPARGAQIARDVLLRLRRPEHEIEASCRLILQHLDMYTVAARRDIEDAATIADFAGTLTGPEALRDLYLLTVADLSATGPDTMTQWKQGMLDALHARTDAWLRGGATSVAGASERLVSIRAQVMACADTGLPATFLQEFLETMPARYLESNTPAEIAAHALCALRVAGMTVSASLVPSRHSEVASLCVVTEGGREGEGGRGLAGADRPGLLAAITAAIAANRLDVHVARIASRCTPDGGAQAVDVFWVRDPVEGAAGVERVLPRLNRDLRAVVSGETTPRALLQSRQNARSFDRPVPSIATAVAVDADGSPKHTVIEVVTKDRPGLLFTLAQTLHEQGLSIALAKIDTEATRAFDVFYVTEADGEKLSPAHAEQVREALLVALEAPAPALG